MFKTKVIDVLQIVASPERQFKYEREVPISNVPAELFCMWFEDYYNPNSSEFVTSFCAVEIKDLYDFNIVFDKLRENVPTDKGVSSLQRNSNWLEIQLSADKLLIKNGW